MRVVLLTTGGDYALRLVRQLDRHGVRLTAIVLDVHRPPLIEALRRPRRALGTFRRLVRARPLMRFGELRVVGNVNSPRALSLLETLRPDLLVLAGARILSEQALSIPRLGSLNAHPARLPGLRGDGVVAWSILRGVPVTVTVHFASAQVDAGDVVERRLVPIEPGDTLDSIEARAGGLCATTLAAVVARASRGEEIPREPQRELGELVRRLDAAGRARSAELVAVGEALRLYREASG